MAAKSISIIVFQDGCHQPRINKLWKGIIPYFWVFLYSSLFNIITIRGEANHCTPRTKTLTPYSFPFHWPLCYLYNEHHYSTPGRCIESKFIYVRNYMDYNVTTGRAQGVVLHRWDQACIAAHFTGSDWSTTPVIEISSHCIPAPTASSQVCQSDRCGELCQAVTSPPGWQLSLHRSHMVVFVKVFFTCQCHIPILSRRMMVIDMKLLMSNAK